MDQTGPHSPVNWFLIATAVGSTVTLDVYKTKTLLIAHANGHLCLDCHCPYWCLNGPCIALLITSDFRSDYERPTLCLCGRFAVQSSACADGAVFLPFLLRPALNSGY